MRLSRGWGVVLVLVIVLLLTQCDGAGEPPPLIDAPEEDPTQTWPNKVLPNAYIVRDIGLDIRVQDMEMTATLANQIMVEYGGAPATLQSRTVGEERYGLLSYTISPQYLEDARQALMGLGHFVGQSNYGSIRQLHPNRSTAEPVALISLWLRSSASKESSP